MDPRESSLFSSHEKANLLYEGIHESFGMHFFFSNDSEAPVSISASKWNSFNPSNLKSQVIQTCLTCLTEVICRYGRILLTSLSTLSYSLSSLGVLPSHGLSTNLLAFSNASKNFSIFSSD